MTAKKDTKFKKGQSGNLKGRPKMDPELRAMRQRSRPEVEKTILKLYNFSEKQLEEMLKGSTLNLWEKHIARIILKGIAKGDHASFTVLSDYIFGKRAEAVHVTSIQQTFNTDISLSQLAQNPDIFDTLVILDAKLKELRTPQS